jgi:DNA-binding response OmpR family regulator
MNDVAALKNGTLGTILLMDDEPIVRESVGRILELLGYLVTATRNGDEALSEFNRAREEGSPFSAAVLDLVIDRGMGGRETVVAMRKSDPTMPILVVSGYCNDPVMAAPRDYQFTDSLSKPFRSALLVAKLEYHLQRAGRGAVAG